MYNSSLSSDFSTFTAETYPGTLIVQGYEKFFQVAAKDTRFSLTAPMGAKKVTPLMLSIMFERKDTFYFILANLPSEKKPVATLLNSQDERGFTAMHHAALRSDRAIMDLLFGLGCDPTIRESNDGTPENLYQLSHPSPQPHFPIHFGKDPIPKEKFTALTGGTYAEEVYAAPETLIKEWANPTVFPLEGSAPIIQQRYPSFLSNPPRLSFEKKAIVGNTAFTLDTIAAGTIVGEYTGEFNPAVKTSDDIYFYPPLLAHKYRNITSLIQDGAPNLIPIGIKANGLGLRIVFVALRDIKAGETLYYNYGYTHMVKQSLYKELNPIELRDWIQDHDPLEIARKCSEKVPNASDIVALRNLGFFIYLGNTPSVALSLLLDGKLTAEQLKRLITGVVEEAIINLFYLCLQWCQKPANPRDDSFRDFTKIIIDRGEVQEALNFVANHETIAGTKPTDKPIDQKLLLFYYATLKKQLLESKINHHQKSA